MVDIISDKNLCVNFGGYSTGIVCHKIYYIMIKSFVMQIYFLRSCIYYH
jgi:hypothetical protein